MHNIYTNTIFVQINLKKTCLILIKVYINSMNEQNYRIGLTTQITGIRPETLRAWERRFSVVKPIRT